MAEYQHFAAIFTTTLIREEFKKVVVDPLKLEFFKCGARTIAIPPVTGRIFPVGMDSTLLTTSSRLAFDPNSYYIAVIARSEKPEVRVALKACEDAVDREITNLSLGEDGLASENLRKAFELRERSSAPEKYAISAVEKVPARRTKTSSPFGKTPTPTSPS
jgi:hypothetical protein